jgi:hypothetical protein
MRQAYHKTPAEDKEASKESPQAKGRESQKATMQ